MKRVTLTTATVVTLSWAGSALSGTLSVPSEFATIQAAVDAAASGDTVLVASGTYTGTGNKNINPGSKELVIQSESGATATIIDCEGSGRALYVAGGQSEAFVFQGFTVRNGLTTNASGVLVDPIDSSITIRDCLFEGCDSGGPVAAVRGRGRLLNSKIIGCDGYWAFMWHGGVIDQLEVIGNSAKSGSVDADEAVTVTNSVFVDNDGRLYITAPHTVQMSNCVIQSSFALEWAADLYPSLMENCTVIGEIQAVCAPVLTFRNCILNSDTGCGDLEVYWGQLTLECCRYDPSTVYEDGELVEVGPQVYADPEFCGESGCLISYVPGSLALSDTSPCLAENSPCGERIGAFDLGCGVASVDESLGGTGHQIDFVSAMPTAGPVRFELRGVSAELLEAEVIASDGRVVLAESLRRSGDSFQTSSLDGLSSGVYFLRVQLDGGETLGRKFVRVSR
ncbi:MAG: hypothetical protein R3E97_11375 [Candidatus Eisenbacteria bacterium]